MTNPSTNQDQGEKNTKAQHKPVIGISIGDINGISFELILKTFNDDRVLNYLTPVIYASTRVGNYHKKSLGYPDFHFNIIKSAEKASENKVNLINAWQEEARVQLGHIKSEAGYYAKQSLDACLHDLNLGLLDGIVTAPTNKHTFELPEGTFSGHTEYLQHQFEALDSLMLMTSEMIKIGVVTTHLPLSEVANTITKDRVYQKVELLHQSMLKDFLKNKPQIALLGLNPHAGENGLLGKEEDEVISPAIEEAQEAGYLAFGPYPADGFFGSQHFQNFDAVLAMYHDQGMIPFKALTFGEGVNYTAGLPIVRTSPDHGPGYAIAGKNEAHESSFREALFTAAKITLNRKKSAEINANPLTNSRLTKETETS